VLRARVADQREVSRHVREADLRRQRVGDGASEGLNCRSMVELLPVQSKDAVKVVTIRTTNFEPAALGGKEV
jgi:hypothetical protein